MKIGVYLREDYLPEIGGGFSYSSRLISAIDKYSFDPEIEIVFVTKNEGVNKKDFNKEVIILPKFSEPPFFDKVRNKLGGYSITRALVDKISYNYANLYESFLRKRSIQLLYYPEAFQIATYEFPFIVTNWDLAYYTMYPFPEVAQGEEYELRKRWFTDCLTKALMIFCESNTGKEELVKYLNVNPAKIAVVPLFPGRVIELAPQKNEELTLLKRYDLQPHKYFIYPAQFWAHKNHYNLILAFKSFLDAQTNKEYKLVLTGSDKGNINYIKNTTTTLGIKNNVEFAGFVDDMALHALYKNAAALAMPTYLEPTNMPLLEALELGCPVICSDFAGHREMLGDAAIYIDPHSSKDIAYAMTNVIKENERSTLLDKMQKVKKDSVFNIEKTLTALNAGFKKAVVVRNCWE